MMTMRQQKDEEPLLPPGLMTAILVIAPLLVLVGMWWLLSDVMKVPAKIWAPIIGVLGIAAAIYFGGRLYKPFYVDKTGRCIAKGPKEREKCRHYIPGARLGGGCGRLRDDRKCRYVR
jgi:hypothetical protein